MEDGWVTRTRIKDSLGGTGVYVPSFGEVFSPPFPIVQACERNGGIWVQALSGYGFDLCPLWSLDSSITTTTLIHSLSEEEASCEIKEP